MIHIQDGRYIDPAGTRVLIGILSCDKYAHRAESIRSTWLPLVPDTYQVVFVHGRPGQPAGMEGDRLYVDNPEAYEFLPRKTHSFLTYALDNFAFDYIFKTDDDTYLDLERFVGFDLDSADYLGQFRELHPPIARDWHYGKCDDKSYEVPYEREFVCPWATGGGYFLSRGAAEVAAARTAATCSESLFEDVMVGEALTRDPALRVVFSRFSHFGVINPLLPKDMVYVHELLLERRRLAEEVRALRNENALLRRHSTTPQETRT